MYHVYMCVHISRQFTKAHAICCVLVGIALIEAATTVATIGFSGLMQQMLQRTLISRHDTHTLLHFHYLYILSLSLSLCLSASLPLCLYIARAYTRYEHWSHVRMYAYTIVQKAR